MVILFLFANWLYAPILQIQIILFANNITLCWKLFLHTNLLLLHLQWFGSRIKHRDEKGNPVQVRCYPRSCKGGEWWVVNGEWVYPVFHFCFPFSKLNTSATVRLRRMGRQSAKPKPEDLPHQRKHYSMLSGEKLKCKSRRTFIFLSFLFSWKQSLKIFQLSKRKFLWWLLS